MALWGLLVVALAAGLFPEALSYTQDTARDRWLMGAPAPSRGVSSGATPPLAILGPPGNESTDLTPCKTNCENFPPDASQGKCREQCSASGCCFHIWHTPGVTGNYNEFGYCFVGFCPGAPLNATSDPTNLAPCQSCPLFPQSGVTKGMCVPGFCANGTSLSLWAVRTATVDVIGVCPAGTCSAAPAAHPIPLLLQLCSVALALLLLAA